MLLHLRETLPPKGILGKNDWNSVNPIFSLFHFLTVLNFPPIGIGTETGIWNNIEIQQLWRKEKLKIQNETQTL